MDKVEQDTIKGKRNKARPFYRQLLICSATWTFYFMLGLSLGTPTVTVPQLRKEANSTESVSEEMGSWISSAAGYVAIIWVIGLSLMAHYIGRKKTIFIISINTFIAFIVLYCSKNILHVLISQIIHGMTAASQITTSLMVLTEYSSPRYRGIFLTIKSATTFWGIWVANAIGAFFDFRNIGLLGIIMSFYNFIVILFMPESPYWLAQKHRYDECAMSHRWLKGEDDNAEKELNTLINDQKDLKRSKKGDKTIKNIFQNIMHNISDPEIYKPVLISILVMALYNFSGKPVCTIYSIQMIKKITNSEKTAYTGMLVLDGFTVLGMYVGCGLSKILKRRILLLWTSTIGTLFTYIMSVYLFLIKYSLLMENNYVSIALLTGFSLAIGCGPMIMTTSIFGELVPVKSRSLCMILVSVLFTSLMGTMFKISPYLFESLGFHGTFMFFAVASTVILILIYFYLPETKDKTLHEIAEYFKHDRSTEVAEMTPLNRNVTA